MNRDFVGFLLDTAVKAAEAKFGVTFAPCGAKCEKCGSDAVYVTYGVNLCSLHHVQAKLDKELNHETH